MIGAVEINRKAVPGYTTESKQSTSSKKTGALFGRSRE